MTIEYVAAKIWAKDIWVDTLKLRQRLTWEQLLLVNQHLEKELSLCRFMEFLSPQEAYTRIGVPLNIDEQLSGCIKKIQTSQMELFRYFDDEKKSKMNRRSLQQNRAAIYSLEEIKAKADQYTLKGKMDRMEELYKFSLKCGVEQSDGLIKLLNKYSAKMPSIANIRMLARSDWYLCQGLRGKSSIEGGPLTQYQINLNSYSSLYKNIQDLEDKPKQAIIDDDDAFDGWLLVRVKQKQAATPKGSKHDNASEVFQFTDNPEEAKQIFLTNSPEAQALQKERFKQMALTKTH